MAKSDSFGGMVEAEDSSESSSAAEHLPLRELTSQSGGIGKWLFQVPEEPRVREYEYTWNGRPYKGKRFEVPMQSPEAGSYCMGQFKCEQGESGEGKAMLH